jgi:hypothetical protein
MIMAVLWRRLFRLAIQIHPIRKLYSRLPLQTKSRHTSRKLQPREVNETSSLKEGEDVYRQERAGRF